MYSFKLICEPVLLIATTQPRLEDLRGVMECMLK